MVQTPNYRGLLYAVHVVLATVATLAFLGQMPQRVALNSNPVTGSGGLAIVALAFPAPIPYLMSVLTSHAWVSKPRTNVYAFLAVLIGAGVASALVTVDAFGWHLGPLALLGVYVAQTLVYWTAIGAWLLKR
jgi:hypothetical protein